MTNEAYTVIRNSFSLQIPDEQLKKSTAENYSEEVKNEIIELSKQKKYLPFVARHLLNLGIDTKFWQEQYDFYKNRNKIIIEFVTKLFDDFHNESINSIFVYENFGGLLVSGGDTALFSSGDVDMCADKTEFEKIDRVFKKYGFELKKQKEQTHNVFRVGYKGKIGDMDYRFNVMFRPLVRYRMPVSVNESAVIPEDDFSFYPGTYIKLPSKEALLYMNMMRISVHGYVRSPDMRLYIDVYNCSVNGVDWEKVIKWAESDGNTVRIVTVAFVANCLFGTSVPDALLKKAEDKSTKASELISIVCDQDKKRLKTSPGRYERQLTEYYSDNRSYLSGTAHLIFPEKSWLNEYYGNPGKGIITSYINYFKFLIRGF